MRIAQKDAKAISVCKLANANFNFHLDAVKQIILYIAFVST